MKKEPQRAHSRSVSSEKNTKKERKFGAASQRNVIFNISVAIA
jgi:hypothetical protein